MSVTLVVNADDFGITQGASDAIVACHLAGSVTSTTLMSSLDAAEYAAQLAKRTPSLGVGLHFNLTLGRPMISGSDATSLVGPSGEFLSRGELLRRCLFLQVKAQQIKEELESQYLRMRELGLMPTHVDSHQHVHVIPVIFRVVSEFASRVKIPLRMPWRWQGAVAEKSMRRRVREFALDQSLRRCNAQKPKEVPSNDGFCSVFDLDVDPAALTLHSYSQLLQPYRSGVVELMVHPAEVDEGLKTRTSITAISDVENRLLRSPEFADHVKALGFHLESYRSLSLR